MLGGVTISAPRTDKGRATRERVLDAATALVFEHGVAGTTLDDVRAAANVSKGQLYHYFADKEDLVHAVIDRTIQQVLDAQPELADLSSWAAISRWFRRLRRSSGRASRRRRLPDRRPRRSTRRNRRTRAPRVSRRL